MTDDKKPEPATKPEPKPDTTTDTIPASITISGPSGHVIRATGIVRFPAIEKLRKIQEILDGD